MRRANWRFRFEVAISALAVATTAAIASPSPTPNQVSQHDQLIQAAQSCHQLTLFQLSQSQTDAQTKEQAAEIDCVTKGQSQSRTTSTGTSYGTTYASQCINQAKEAYNLTVSGLDQQRVAADGLLTKEIAAIGYIFSNINGCPQACSAGMRQTFSTPAAQLRCSQLSSQLGVSSP